MIGDPSAMSAENIELQTRVAELSSAIERLTEERDHLADAAKSLFEELENTHRELKIWQSAVDRLRTHIQQGVEL